MQQGMLFLRQAFCLVDATCMQGILHAGGCRLCQERRLLRICQIAVKLKLKKLFILVFVFIRTVGESPRQL